MEHRRRQEWRLWLACLSSSGTHFFPPPDPLTPLPPPPAPHSHPRTPRPTHSYHRPQPRFPDVTALVESHHFGERVWKVLAKYETTTIPKGTTPIEPMGYTFSETGFFRTLKRRFVQRMHSAGRDPRDGPPWTYGVRLAHARTHTLQGPVHTRARTHTHAHGYM